MKFTDTILNMNHSLLERIRDMNVKLLKSSVLTGVLGMLGLCSLSIPAQAVNVNGVINATITLAGACSINGSAPTAGATWGTLNFGSQSTLFTTATAQVTGTGSSPISLQCATTTPPTLTIVSGTNDSNAGSGHLHAMASGSKYVPYDVYTDAGHSSKISNGTAFFTSANNGTAESVNIYGQATGVSGLTPGTYTDTLTVQLTY